VYVEVTHNEEGEPKVGEKNFWYDGVDSVVNSIGRVGFDNPKGVEISAKKRLIGGDVKGENILLPIKPGEHRVVGKKRHMNVGSHAWFLNRGKKGLKNIKRGKVSFVDRWILQQDYPGVGGRFSERLE